MEVKVREKSAVRLSSDLHRKVSIIAAQKGVTKNAALETLLNLGLDVHNLIETGLVIPKAS